MLSCDLCKQTSKNTLLSVSRYPSGVDSGYASGTVLLKGRAWLGGGSMLCGAAGWRSSGLNGIRVSSESRAVGWGGVGGVCKVLFTWEIEKLASGVRGMRTKKEARRHMLCGGRPDGVQLSVVWLLWLYDSICIYLCL